MKRCYHANSNHKKVRVGILISDKIDVKTINCTMHDKRYSVKIKGSIHQEDKTIINIYAPNNNTWRKKIHEERKTEMKGEIENLAILAETSIPHFQ